VSPEILLQSFGSFVVEHLELDMMAEIGKPCVHDGVCIDEGRLGAVKEQF
jgi:hypothetical protein